MKVLIWVITLILGTILNAILGAATGMRVGAVVLYVLEALLAYALCKVYDKKQQATQDQIRASIIEDNKEVFFDKCLDLLQKKSADLGFYKSVLAIPPDILRAGDSSVALLLNDNYYKPELSDSLKEQYFPIMSSSLYLGFIAASKSKNNNIDEELSSIILSHSIDSEAQKPMKKLFENYEETDEEAKEEYTEAIFDTFLATIKPYLNVKSWEDMQEYLAAALTAVYQLGVSVSISRL